MHGTMFGNGVTMVKAPATPPAQESEVQVELEQPLADLAQQVCLDDHCKKLAAMLRPFQLDFLRDLCHLLLANK